MTVQVQSRPRTRNRLQLQRAATGLTAKVPRPTDRPNALSRAYNYAQTRRPGQDAPAAPGRGAPPVPATTFLPSFPSSLLSEDPWSLLVLFLLLSPVYPSPVSIKSLPRTRRPWLHAGRPQLMPMHRVCVTLLPTPTHHRAPPPPPCRWSMQCNRKDAKMQCTQLQGRNDKGVKKGGVEGGRRGAPAGLAPLAPRVL